MSEFIGMILVLWGLFLLPALPICVAAWFLDRGPMDRRHHHHLPNRRHRRDDHRLLAAVFGGGRTHVAVPRLGRLRRPAELHDLAGD